MARRRTARATPAADGQTPILPPELATYDGNGADDYRRFWRERNRWLTEHGIDPADWPKVHAVLRASWSAHGIVTARERLRVADRDG